MNWNGRRVLITGHTGFKGGWLALWLERLGAQVFGYSLPPGTPALYHQAEVRAALAGETLADLRDAGPLGQAFRDSRPEAVFHLAAQALVRPSYDDPVGTFATNVLGTAQVLEAARATDSVRAVVVVTSDKCYENREWIWPYRENEPMGGADPYSASKGCAELLTASWRRSFFNAPGAALVATCRAGNVYGGGDWAPDRLVPDIARAMRAGAPVRLRNPRSVRPWQFVLEPLRGYLMVADRLLARDAGCATGWNFGPAPEAEMPVSELARAMAGAWGAGEIIEDPQTGQVHEAGLLRLDSSKAAHELRWKPLLDITESLRWTVEWYQCCLQDETALASLTRRQIDAYQKLWDSAA